jgi:hypothetical protein
MKSSVLLLSSVSVLAFLSAANAESTISPSIGAVAQNILSSMSSAGGSETLQWEVAPSYSELFGLGVRTTVGGLVNEDFALGVIIDYADHREEYLANAGVRLNDNMRVIGSVGVLKESEEFTLGEGRQDVEQLEYGLSLKGDYEAGIVRGFELNAYATEASSDTDTVETGDLTGVQLVTRLKPSDASDIRIGAGYERAEWDGGEVDEGFTFQALGSQKLSDMLSLNYSAKSAETEDVFGLGLTYDLSSANVQNSALSVSFNQIEGKHGVSDDTRVAVNWTVGLGGAASAGASDVITSSMGGKPWQVRESLLAEVMTRPAFLPARVLARASEMQLPPQLAAQSFNYAENQAAGYVIGTVQATDDVAVTQFRFVTADGTPIGTTSVDGYFTIDADGKLIMTAAGAAAPGVNDFNSGSATSIYYVQAGDAENSWSTPQQVTLNKTDDLTDNDTIAPELAAQSFSYVENQAAGYVVGSVQANDDVAVTQFRFTATQTSLSSDGYFSIDATGAITLTAAGAAEGIAANDYETTPNSFSYGIEAGDGTNWSQSQDISFALTDDPYDTTNWCIIPTDASGYDDFVFFTAASVGGDARGRVGLDGLRLTMTPFGDRYFTSMTWSLDNLTTNVADIAPYSANRGQAIVEFWGDAWGLGTVGGTQTVELTASATSECGDVITQAYRLTVTTPTDLVDSSSSFVSSAVSVTLAP